MARFLNINTLQWREDDGTGLERDNELRNPDISTVANIPTKYWRIANGILDEMTDEQKLVVDNAELEVVKVAKIAEIDVRTQALLAIGVKINDKSISCSLAAQHNLNALTVGLMIGRTKFPRGISTIDGGEYIISDQDEFGIISKLVWDRVSLILDQGRALRLQILSKSTIDEVNAVNDSRE